MVRPTTLGRTPAQRPPWLVSQRWEHLLFAHWATDPERLAQLLPRGVEPDTRDGSAWLAIVAFVMVGTRPMLAPARAALPPIPELNVRTYVRVGGVPAVWFLSLDASSPLFVSVGRALYGLGYRRARMAVASDGACVHYLSERTGAAFCAAYAPTGEPRRAATGSLDDFLFERYRLFARRGRGLVTAVVAHEPWPLQAAAARIDLNRMAPRGLSFEGEPLVHYCRGVDARISWPQQVAAAQRGSTTRPLRAREVAT